MTSAPGRRDVLAALGAGAASLAGCAGLPGGVGGVDSTVYVGAYHWGFVLVDEAGTEQDRVVLQRGETVRVVAFNVEAGRAVEALPASVREALPDHETLEERNEDRLPPPPGGDFHEALTEANERFPDHSLGIVPSGQVHGPGGMMLHPVALAHDARSPTVRRLAATRRGDYTLACLTDCGYGHPYMEVDGGLVVV